MRVEFSVMIDSALLILFLGGLLYAPFQIRQDQTKLQEEVLTLDQRLDLDRQIYIYSIWIALSYLTLGWILYSRYIKRSKK